MRNEDRRAGAGEVREPDYSVAFSPRQVAGGFAILAALIVLVLRRRRGKKMG